MPNYPRTALCFFKENSCCTRKDRSLPAALPRRGGRTFVYSGSQTEFTLNHFNSHCRFCTVAISNPVGKSKRGRCPLFVVLKEKNHKRRENRNSLLLCGLFWFVFSSGRENEHALLRRLSGKLFSATVQIMKERGTHF